MRGDVLCLLAEDALSMWRKVVGDREAAQWVWTVVVLTAALAALVSTL